MASLQGTFSDRAARLPWPLPAALVPLLYIWLAWTWWREIHAQLTAAADAAPAMDPGAMASVALGARVCATLSEAGCYALWWRGRGARLPYWRFTAWVAALSSADLFGFALRHAVEDGSHASRLLAAMLAGPAALDPSAVAASGLGAAFGTLGMLTVLRVAGTAWAQARATGRPLTGPLALTCAAWLLTRLAAWWSFDLLKGLSPVP